MEDMKKMFGKKDKSSESPKKEAKLSALQSLRDEMSDMMKGDLGGRINKVTVAAKDKSGLEEGLDKAKEVLHTMPEEDESLKEDFSDPQEESETDHEEGNMSVEEIDTMMKQLMEMKKKLSGQ